MAFKVSLLLSTLVIFTSFVYAQSEIQTTKKEELKANTIFVELLGQSVGFFSLNCDYRFHLNFTFRIGVGLTLGYSIPVSVSFIFPSESYHHLEVSIGGTYLEGASLFGGDGVISVVLVPGIGYRFQPKEGGFVFRATYTPWINLGNPRNSSYLMGGISLGYCF